VVGAFSATRGGVHIDASSPFPESWRPRPGDSVKGKVVDLDVRDGEYGQYPLVTLDTADRGQVTIHAFHEVLASELARRAPKPGDVIEVSYRGQHPHKGYHLYQVTGDGDLAFNWNKFGGADPDPAFVTDTGDDTRF
jgi:hypothetical protein